MRPSRLRRALPAFLAVALAACSSPSESSPDGNLARPDGGVSPAPDGGGGGTPAACSAVASQTSDPESYAAILGCLREPSESAAAKEQAVRAFVAAVDARGGFPIVDDGSLIFVYVRHPDFDPEDDQSRTDEDFAADRRREPIRVAGAFNGWQPDIVLSHEGHELFHARASHADPEGKRWTYKLVAKDGAGQDVWFSDPLSRRFDYDDNGRISIVRGGDSQGHLERLGPVHATALGNDRMVHLYLPRGYDSPGAGGTAYPVLYMHDGNNLFSTAQPGCSSSSWRAAEVAETELAAGRVRPFIIVGAYNTSDRMNEYTHAPDTIGSTAYPGRGAQYADFLLNDLKPLVDARYRTLPGRDFTGILGSSLGGLISYYVALEHPEAFKLVGGMSSTFGWGSAPEARVLALYAAQADLASRGQVYYLDSGGQPPPGGEQDCTYDLHDDSGDSDNYCVTRKMVETLNALGIDTFPVDPAAFPLVSSAPPAPIDILHDWAPGAAHDENAWHDRLPMVFRLFFPP